MERSKILVVDDEAMTRLSMAMTLQDANYNVSQAKEGQEALNMILKREHEEDPFNLLITDINMPVMNGVELIKRIKKFNFQIPIIVASDCSKNVISALKQFGNPPMLKKPFLPDELLVKTELMLRFAV